MSTSSSDDLLLSIFEELSLYMAAYAQQHTLTKKCTLGTGAGAMRLVKLETLPRKPFTEAEGALSMLAVCSDAGDARSLEGELVAEEGAEGRSGGTCSLVCPELLMSCALLFLRCIAACMRRRSSPSIHCQIKRLIVGSPARSFSPGPCQI